MKRHLVAAGDLQVGVCGCSGSGYRVKVEDPVSDLSGRQAEALADCSAAVATDVCRAGCVREGWRGPEGVQLQSRGFNLLRQDELCGNEQC